MVTQLVGRRYCRQRASSHHFTMMPKRGVRLSERQEFSSLSEHMPSHLPWRLDFVFGWRRSGRFFLLIIATRFGIRFAQKTRVRVLSCLMLPQCSFSKFL